MSRKSVTPALSHQWRQHIENWRISGLSEQAFYRDLNLSFNQFHYWRNKLMHPAANKTWSQISALVPKLRVNLTRFHGVFAPNSKHWIDVMPGKRGKGRAKQENEEKIPVQRHQAMIPDQVRGRLWAQRLKRVFNIDRCCASMHSRHY